MTLKADPVFVLVDKATEDITEAHQVTDEMKEAAESIFDGWYADGQRIDWEDFFERLEKGQPWDFGADWDTPAIKAIKKHVRAYSKL